MGAAGIKVGAQTGTQPRKKTEKREMNQVVSGKPEPFALEEEN